MNAHDLQKLQTKALEELASISSDQELQTWHTNYLGRKQGKLTEIMKSLKDLSAEEKRELGPAANVAKKELTKAHEDKALELAGGSSDQIDKTLPAIMPLQGNLHLVTQTISEVTDIFKRIGFTRVRYPEVETDYHAFGSLNFPPEHPARDEWETFFIDDASKGDDRRVLTPHTSSGQIREMKKGKLPIRMINISKCYRRQSDISHTQMFHQFEGLYIDENVSIQHLKGVMDYFVKAFFGNEREIRLRPYDFNFTEPSFEIDITCSVCSGSGCKLCKEGWLEMGGSGMVHPKVLKAGGIDTKKYNGFAFGWGVERVALMKEGIAIPDLRELYRNDLRFLQQF